MKRVLKIIAILIGLVALIVLGGAAWIQFGGIPTYKPESPEITITADSAMIAEGRRISSMVCSQCHKGDNGLMEGKFMADIPAMFGKGWASNITHHPESRLAGYTDGELAYFLRTGIKRDGGFAPFMPRFNLLSDQDLNSVIAYLRSDAPELQPSEKVQPPMQYSFFSKFLCRVAFKPIPYPTEPVPAPDTTNKVAFGKYMSTAKVECFSCHSESFETTNNITPDLTPGYFAGGNPMLDMEGNLVPSRNLTPDKDTGIGNWTEEQFIKAVKYGQRDGKPALRYPMVPYSAMTDTEVSAIYAYLQTIPAISNDVDALFAEKGK